MKKKNLAKLRTIFSRKNVFGVVKIAMIVYLVYGVWYCFKSYQKWSIIPNHIIEAKLTAEGYISPHSYCNLKLKIEAGKYLQHQSQSGANIIKIWNCDQFTDTIPLYLLYNGKLSYLRDQYPHIFEAKKTFYFMDYQMHTNIKSKPLNRLNDETRKPHSTEGSFSFGDIPDVTSDSLGTHSSGSAIVGFGQYHGESELGFMTNLLNISPSFFSRWDITQANYNIRFSCNNIKCDTISIEFIGATDFSAMYPIPDIITMSGIEFTNPAKIGIIKTNGLRFHTDFIELKEMSARRTFLLSAVLSLLISIIASIIFKLIFD